jgi:FkbM family methyltransferase
MKFSHAPNIDGAKKILQETAQTPIKSAPRKVDRPLVLYGAGDLGRMAKQYFNQIGIDFKYVVDSNPEPHRNDPFWAGIDVISPAEVSFKEHSESLLAVCIATTQFGLLNIELELQGWTDLVPFYDIAEAYRDLHPLGNGWFSGKLSQIDIENTELVLSGWQDDTSRAHHLQFIAWRALRQDWLFEDAPVTLNDRYFIPEVASLLKTDEIFCDLGAYHAGVIHRFLRTTGNRFKEIWAIEPDKANVSQLRAELQKLDSKIEQRIHVLACAVGAREERENFFHGLGYTSQLCDLGQYPIEVTTIDQLSLAPTFLKLHLEGGELNAMQGGLQALKRFRPIIAATIYHNRLGIWEVPKWLMGNLVDYHFLMRLHSWCGTGAVIYGIPKERHDANIKFKMTAMNMD